MSIKVVRGADKSFTIKLRKQNGDPYQKLPDATLVQVKIPTVSGELILDDREIPAVRASKAVIYDTEEDPIIFTAEALGKIGNNIQLIFDGIETVAAVVAAWNSANPSNQVTFSGVADGNLVLDTQVVNLDNGVDAYKKVQIVDPSVIGFLLVGLSNEDTNSLKLGDNQSISVIIDRGSHPIGDRDTIKIPYAISVEE